MTSAVDLNAFKFDACVDWIELRVHTLPDADGRATNAWSLRDYLCELGVTFACPIDKGDGGAATKFLIRIQEPQSAKHVRAVVGRLRERRQLADEPTIAAIEIAFDARPKVLDDAALDRMTLRFMRGLLPPSRELRSPRQTTEWPVGTGWRNTRLTLSLDLDPRETFYIGSIDVARHANPGYVQGTIGTRDDARWQAWTGLRSPGELVLDDAQWRVYRKVTDERFTDDGEHLETSALPKSKHRARAEVTLSGSILRELKLETLDDLAAFDFRQIIERELLKFTKSAGKHLVIDDASADHWFSPQRLLIRQFGVSADSPACVIQSLWRRRSRGREAAKLSPFLRFDNDLNDILRKRLARLTGTFAG